MPSLVPIAWTKEEPHIPCGWSCSDCIVVFDMGSMHKNSIDPRQYEWVNVQFEMHCKNMHAGMVPVSGLELPH